ncbi:wek [Drosophila busckii]|uniref:Wek n=2 Tax=Drosophila busckii TaxID=30019 RepID=A0A0M4F5K6_DROBS|nr:wek [Drosophila busckii]
MGAEITDSHWLNWCRLCGKGDLQGNVKVCSNEDENSWNSVLVMAIRKYFDVQMLLEDELSGVLCKECYTLISELIDFAEHVSKVQTFFEILRHSEPNKQHNVEVLRRQLELRDGDWTHIIKPDAESQTVKCTKEKIPNEEQQHVLKQELVDMDGTDNETVVHLPIEEVLVAGCEAADVLENDNKRTRGRRKLKRTNATSVFSKASTKKREFNQKEPIAESDTSSTYISQDVTESDSPDCELGSIKRTSLECDWCGKLYKNPASYEKHKERGCRRIEQRPRVDKNTYCDICNKTLSSAAALKLHKDGIHGDIKPFVCDHCGKQLKTKTALNEHKLVHTEDRPFTCKVCNAGFKNRARLKMHHQIHEEPNYTCNICGKKLQTRRTWNMHKLVHSEERKFKCNVCGAHFKRSKTLKTHLLSHTGLRPYVCTYCGQTFACNANCRAHKMKKHPLELAKEDGAGPATRVNVPTLDELRVM